MLYSQEQQKRREISTIQYDTFSSSGLISGPNLSLFHHNPELAQPQEDPALDRSGGQSQVPSNLFVGKTLEKCHFDDPRLLRREIAEQEVELAMRMVRRKLTIRLLLGQVVKGLDNLHLAPLVPKGVNRAIPGNVEQPGRGFTAVRGILARLLPKIQKHLLNHFFGHSLVMNDIVG